MDVGVDLGVGVSLSALDCEATVVEASGQQHLVHLGVAPIVRSRLRVELNSVVVVSALQDQRRSKDLAHGEKDEVLSEHLVGAFEGSLVVEALAHSIRDQALSVADEQQHTSVLRSVESGDVGD